MEMPSAPSRSDPNPAYPPPPRARHPLDRDSAEENAVLRRSVWDMRHPRESAPRAHPDTTQWGQLALATVAVIAAQVAREAALAPAEAERPAREPPEVPHYSQPSATAVKSRTIIFYNA